MADVNLEQILQRLDELESQIKNSRDVEQIKQLFIRYINAKNEGKPEDELACLAKDAVVVGGAPPPSRGGSIPPQAGQHGVNKASAFVVHPLVTVDGNKATGKWLHYVMHAHIHTFQSLYWVQSTYDVQYIKENGEWKISWLKWEPKIGPPIPHHGQPVTGPH
jgi:hypothetical protein